MELLGCGVVRSNSAKTRKSNGVDDKLLCLNLDGRAESKTQFASKILWWGCTVMSAVPWHVRDPSRRKLTTRLNEISSWEKRILNQIEDLLQIPDDISIRIWKCPAHDATKGITVIFFFLSKHPRRKNVVTWYVLAFKVYAWDSRSYCLPASEYLKGYQCAIVCRYCDITIVYFYDSYLNNSQSQQTWKEQFIFTAIWAGKTTLLINDVFHASASCRQTSGLHLN